MESVLTSSKVLGLCCRWCSYAAADLAGSMRLQYPPEVRILMLPCTGRVDILHLLRAFELGYDAVFLSGCHEGDCAGSGNWPGPFEKEKTEHGSFKAEDIRATSADLVIAGCSNCRDQIMKNLKPKFRLDIEVKYIWEMIADALILEG